ncbi:hypothetical protein EBAPG3_009505 [Nitrosospira lacus]|uniref:Uncharacterized protein n=1 Tax=Nitrosospira lacus TaxID=1288494 RepID=A0A1W6SQ89_9PROT|nr:hypothetical protein [Nitrosospira lacus]ARO87984.3 hypothetical protein EBAPG3_009505 [Nitrosospira lacus]
MFGITALCLFYVLGTMALVLMITAPENKYEWMIEADPSISRSGLPEDLDADMRTFLLCMPAVIFSLMNFILSKWVFKNRKARNLSMLIGVFTLLSVAVKVL